MQAPDPLVAASALSTVSLACHSFADVRRANHLEGPISPFFLSLAPSGERKSTCDNFFAKPVRNWDAAMAASMKPELRRHLAAMSAWTAERQGIARAIRDPGKKGNAACRPPA